MVMIKSHGKIWGLPAVKYEFAGSDYDRVFSADAVMGILEWDKGSVTFEFHPDAVCEHYYYKAGEVDEQDGYYDNDPKNRKATLLIVIAKQNHPVDNSSISHETNHRLVDLLDNKLFEAKNKRPPIMQESPSSPAFLE